MTGFEAASVTELVSHIKGLLEEEFQEVMVQGEVSNLSPSASGHWYFTLSDEESCISCALFRGDALRNPLIRTLKDGDKIVVLGPISVYQKRGSFQLITKRLLPAGAGQLKLQFEKLKAKLAAEGLFDLERKKPLPKFPHRVAVITAEHGAALQDFLNVLKRRSLWFDVAIIPALVQGAQAAKSLIEGIKRAQVLADVDLIVLTRGGGSMEDLWCFNDEALIREIANCKIPVISAIGHEVDYTLSDYVSDHRSETPTAAAETISQPQTELSARMQFCQSHLRSELFKFRQKLELMNQKFHPREMIGLIWQKIQVAQKRIGEIRLRDRAHELMGLMEASQRLDECQFKISHLMPLRVSAVSEKLNRLQHVLGALDPKNVLGRGYSYVQTSSGQVVTSASAFTKLPSGALLTLHFQDGEGSVKKESK